jgi:hypothetical protein
MRQLPSPLVIVSQVSFSSRQAIARSAVPVKAIALPDSSDVLQFDYPDAAW